MSPTGRWVKKVKAWRRSNRGHLNGGPGFTVFFVTAARRVAVAQAKSSSSYFGHFPYKVPSGSSLACCRRITVAATPYSPRAAASGRPLRITFCSTSGRRPSRAQAGCACSPRLEGNWVALICPATSNHRQAHADLEPGRGAASKGQSRLLLPCPADWNEAGPFAFRFCIPRCRE